MKDNTQPEALRLAALLDADEWPGSMTLVSYARACAAELCRQHTRIAELESQLEAIDAGGVSGPLMGRAMDHFRDATKMMGRWYMVNKMGMATLCASKADAEKEAADAQRFWPHMGPHRAVQLVEAGHESAAANAGGEPVAHLWQHCETGRTRIVMPDMIVDADASWQVVGPLYLGAAPPTAQAEGWTRLPGAVYAELPQPDSWFHFTAQFWENKLRDFADRTHALRTQQQAPATQQAGWTNADADAARLALELECLLMDTKDTAAVSKWWQSANEALELHRARLQEVQPSPTARAADYGGNMATIERGVTYRCSDDCVPSGCPGHKGRLTYQSTADSYLFNMNGRELHFERGELDAMIELLKKLDRCDCVQVTPNAELTGDPLAGRPR